MNEEHGTPKLDVKVFSPREPDPKAFSWPKNMLVREAASEAAAAFGYPQGVTASFQKDGVVLDRDKNLVAAGVRTGDVLELVDIGGGV